MATVWTVILSLPPSTAVGFLGLDQFDHALGGSKACSRPKPPPAPVTIATSPSKRIVIIFLPTATNKATS